MRFSHDGEYADWLDLECWMTDPALACYGGFADEAVHAIDALQWLLGPIDTAQAVTGNVLGWPVDDHGASPHKLPAAIRSSGCKPAFFAGPPPAFDFNGH